VSPCAQQDQGGALLHPHQGHAAMGGEEGLATIIKGLAACCLCFSWGFIGLIVVVVWWCCYLKRPSGCDHGHLQVLAIVGSLPMWGPFLSNASTWTDAMGSPVSMNQQLEPL